MQVQKLTEEVAQLKTKLATKVREVSNNVPLCFCGDRLHVCGQTLNLPAPVTHLAEDKISPHEGAMALQELLCFAQPAVLCV